MARKIEKKTKPPARARVRGRLTPLTIKVRGETFFNLEQFFFRLSSVKAMARKLNRLGFRTSIQRTPLNEFLLYTRPKVTLESQRTRP